MYVFPDRTPKGLKNILIERKGDRCLWDEVGRYEKGDSKTLYDFHDEQPEIVHFL